MQSIRYYIDKKNDTISNMQTNYIKCKKDGDKIECEKDGVKVRHVSGKWKPVDDNGEISSDKPNAEQKELIDYLTGKHASMSLSFNHEICTKTFFCKEDGEEVYCSNKEIIIQEVVCGEGLKKCDDNICHDIRTDPNHCGDCENKCSSTAPDNGSQYICESGKCVPVCDDGYHVEEDEKNEKKCIEDNQFNCKGVNCTETIPGWSTGKCEAGKCTIETCQDNMYLSNNKCEVVSNANCGEFGKSCGLNENCVYNNGNYECQSISCEDIDSTLRDCGEKGCLPEATYACGSECINCYEQSIDHASRRSCDGGKCVFECDSGYHKNEAGDACEQDSPEACGAWNNACLSNQTCNNGKCECKEGYADCDNDGNCETNLEAYGLESCDKCGSTYTQCGKTKTKDYREIPLCLTLNGISEMECAAICNYDDWKLNNEIAQQCPVDKYISCEKDGTERYHTKVNTCIANENPCNIDKYTVLHDKHDKKKEYYREARSIKYVYLDKAALERYLNILQTTVSPPGKANFYTYRVNTCKYKNNCRLDNGGYNAQETKTTNTDPEKTFYPLLVKCE